MTTITINGKIMATVEKVYEGKKTTYAQFLMESEAKGMEVIKVKITIDSDIPLLQKGEFVSIPVSVVSGNGNLYFTQSEAMKKTEVKRA